MTTSSVVVSRKKYVNADANTANTVDNFRRYLNGLTIDERLLLRSLLTDDKCTFSKDENTSPFLFNLLNDHIVMRIMQEVCKDKDNNLCIFFTSRRMFTLGLPLVSERLATCKWKNAIVSNKPMAAFLQREVRSVVHKTVLLDTIHAYIRDRSLQNNPQNIFQIKTDKTLRTILKLNKNDTLTYLSLPRHLAKYSRKKRKNILGTNINQSPLSISDELAAFFKPHKDDKNAYYDVSRIPPITLNNCKMKRGHIFLLMKNYIVRLNSMYDSRRPIYNDTYIRLDTPLKTLLDLKDTHVLTYSKLRYHLSCHF